MIFLFMFFHSLFVAGGCLAFQLKRRGLAVFLAVIAGIIIAATIEYAKMEYVTQHGIIRCE